MRKNNQYYVRKAHRWLGVIIGVQFVFWTISGLYFSWTDIDEIHGDHFLKEAEAPALSAAVFRNLDSALIIHSVSLRSIGDESLLWVNDSLLIDPNTGETRNEISQTEAEKIAMSQVADQFELERTELLSSVGAHHEYRGRPLPVWAIHFKGGDNLTAYVTQKDGSFQRVRHTSWRWFDFLWMFHTMDYQGRDDFNNLLLRAFSLFGLFTVGSGFTLFFITGKKKRRKKKVNVK